MELIFILFLDFRETEIRDRIVVEGEIEIEIEIEIGKRRNDTQEVVVEDMVVVINVVMNKTTKVSLQKMEHHLNQSQNQRLNRSRVNNNNNNIHRITQPRHLVVTKTLINHIHKNLRRTHRRIKVVIMAQKEVVAVVVRVKSIRVNLVTKIIKQVEHQQEQQQQRQIVQRH